MADTPRECDEGKPMKLRQNQADMVRLVNEIIAGSPVKNIIVSSYPGTGKSTIPVIAGKLIKERRADRIAWICPRLSLQDQGERSFLDPFFRQMFGHNLTIRSSTNENDPSRGTNGWISTYQALGMDNRKMALGEFRRWRYILVLDEYHHLEEQGEWTEPIRELYEAAEYRVLMTGTLSRHDQKKIAFTPYRNAGEGAFEPILEGNQDTAVIEYGRAAALRERAILPMSFVFSDGTATWQKLTGKVVEARLSTAKNSSHALFTALNTEYAEELLSATIDHWAHHRANVNPGAKLLVVCARIDDAKKMAGKLAEWGQRATIATSDDSKEAVAAIRAYKSKSVDILVSVMMASEGLDVPAISHIACLTNIRSTEWITQMVARAVRIDPGGGPYEAQRAYIFAPADPLFREIAAKIEADQTAPAIEQRTGQGNGKAVNPDGAYDGLGVPQAPGGIKPLSSRLTGCDELPLFGGYAPAPEGPVPEIRTHRERETDLLQQIETHIRRYCFNNRINPKRLNSEVYQRFDGKPRRQMTIRELEKVLAWVRERYPIGYIRGTGRPRVPTKAAPYACTWR